MEDRVFVKSQVVPCLCYREEMVLLSHVHYCLVLVRLRIKLMISTTIYGCTSI